MAVVAWRNNNPGNLSFGKLAKSFGATGFVKLPDGQINAIFPSLSSGYSAFKSLTSSWAATKGGFGSWPYATGKGWAAGVAQFSGISPNATLNASNLDAVRYGIMRQEGLSDAQIKQITAGKGSGSPVDALTGSGMGDDGPAGGQNGLETSLSYYEPNSGQGGSTGAGASATTPGSEGGSETTPADQSQGTSPEQQGGFGKGQGGSSGSGLPIQITNAEKVGEKSAKTVKEGIDELTKGLAQDTQSAISAGTGWLGTFQQGAVDILIRGGLFLLAIVLLAGVWLLLSAEGKKVNVAIGR